MRKAGRPTKLTKKVRDVIIEGLEVGMTYEHAAKRAGVTYDTFRNWRNRGEELAVIVDQAENDTELTDDDFLFLSFFKAVEAANSEAQFNHLVNLENHSSSDPRVSMWILENRFPNDFKGNRNRVEVTGENGGPVGVLVYLPDNKRDRGGDEPESD